MDRRLRAVTSTLAVPTFPRITVCTAFPATRNVCSKSVATRMQCQWSGGSCFKLLELHGCGSCLFCSLVQTQDTLEFCGSLHRICGIWLQNGMNKWQNGFFSQRDGCVYAVPQRADGVLRVVPATPSNGESAWCNSLDPQWCVRGWKFFRSPWLKVLSLVAGLEEDFVEVLDCGEECRAFKEKFEGGVLSHQVRCVLASESCAGWALCVCFARGRIAVAKLDRCSLTPTVDARRAIFTASHFEPSTC